MYPKVVSAKNAYLQMTSKEKMAFIKEILEYHSESNNETISLEALGSAINETMINLGPRDSRCLLCGRS
ncbi:hypothetical protein [Pseudomonas sp. UBA4034]|uniref:hypothetical protein n=1 Tax=Pseudomonas sp. UBA4034 TaxID=1947315 RepID=UPI00257D9AC5|nr:hypothetical protein [Pseudomonas sp. UBA4034]